MTRSVFRDDHSLSGPGIEPANALSTALNRRDVLWSGLGAVGGMLALPGLAWARSKESAQAQGSATGLNEVDELLILALQHEHGAMVQYSNHAGLLAQWIQPEFAATIREIICDEVSHAIVLVQALTARGAQPTLAVWPPRTSSRSRELLQQDIAAERGAVELYSRIIDQDIDPDLRRSLETIRNAEKLHQHLFTELLEKAG